MMVEKVVNKLVSIETVKEALSFLKEDNDNTTKDQIDITSIPAPTFQEQVRGEDFVRRFRELGLENVHVDDVGNVIGTKVGTGTGPKLVVSAHLDTVFPEGTDVKPKLRDGKIYAPGISDDGRGLAVLLTLLRALNHSNIKTIGDLVFVATVGEEGLGDLRGVKALFQERDDIDGFISIEPGEPNRTVYLGTGSRRYRVTYKGPGGHSFGNFGTPSAIHALGRAIAKISELETPIQPRTTFNIGTIDGGTSVNTIAAQASMLVDIRSTSQEELTKLEQKILSVSQSAARDENQRWNKDAISVDLELVGDRPAGSQSAESLIVQASLAADVALGYKPELCEPSSTDSNVPISLGIPAVTLGGGGDLGGVHTLEEYFDPQDAYVGPQKILLTALGLVGVEDETKPLLVKLK
ncbi:M20/M25/M40 family metallo-hydrolase [Bacillus luteolus]|uniref:M20/M25/M40 family metallo-hydrolase n=1 Tax=Litchfieldia luteola TaxID=682179 RepID=A0ABR9QQ49_9BACI|nr:M20/M25/M40 family metallo-hydrolase [Cytobacillus luteolus]MBE4910640.1 M20/M25/M40 family metallo-hydrolase [Cytobacillus luteolus]MBP1943819.1 acetylornithine deacetylase/succinyl-diaminopimelate desuccinylase-like protein [Cytobacillus luteolus]